jgi:hypothetical protein
VVIVSGGGAVIVNVKALLLLCAGVPESVTLNVSDVPAAGESGVPLSTPVEAFNVKPCGSVPEANCQR